MMIYTLQGWIDDPWVYAKFVDVKSTMWDVYTCDRKDFIAYV
jgi:hypothetical protein